MKLWIARNKDNSLILFNTKPKLYYSDYWDGEYDTYCIFLDENMFPEVTFENSPQEVELKLVK